LGLFQLCSLVFLVCLESLQVFIKFVLETGHRSCLAMDIYWKDVETGHRSCLATENLKALFSDCPNFTSCTLLFGRQMTMTCG